MRSARPLIVLIALFSRPCGAVGCCTSLLYLPLSRGPGRGTPCGYVSGCRVAGVGRGRLGTQDQSAPARRSRSAARTRRTSSGPLIVGWTTVTHSTADHSLK